MRNEKGAITLEACVAVLSFLILMLLLSSLFVMFMAQNATAHALLEATESLSLDAYSTEKLTIEKGHIGSVGDYVGQFVKKLFGSSEDSPYFVSDDRWYDASASGTSGSGSSGGGRTGSSETANAVRTRFIGYLAGGDEAEADRMLESMNVVDGLDGIDFSSCSVEDDVLHAEIHYTLQYDFNIWNIGTVPVEQSACSKLWK